MNFVKMYFNSVAPIRLGPVTHLVKLFLALIITMNCEEAAQYKHEE
jgi:hypothetical protein